MISKSSFFFRKEVYTVTLFFLFYMQRFIASYMCAYFSKFYSTSDKTTTMFYVLQSTRARLEEELGVAKISPFVKF